MNTPPEHLPSRPRPAGLGRLSKTALWMLALISGFYLLREHWGHVTGNWIYLLLLACPLMHLFHGHGGHGQHGAATDTFESKKD